MQWLGSREQRHIATVSIQVLVSFTPLTRRPAPAARNSRTGPAEHLRLMRVKKEGKRSSNAAAAQNLSEEAESSAGDSAEESVQGQEAVGIMETHTVQEGASQSADAWLDGSAPTATVTAVGSTLELADAEPDLASLPRPGSRGWRVAGSSTFTPASRVGKAAEEEVRSCFTFALHSPSTRGDFASQLAAGHISAGLPRLAEFLPPAAPSSPPEAVLLPPAASWRLPSTDTGPIRPPSVVTGIPVMPMNAINAATGGFWGPWNGTNLHPSAQLSAAVTSGSGPDIDALIQRAERLRAQMTATVGAAAPLYSSMPPKGQLQIGAGSTDASTQLHTGGAGSEAGVNGAPLARTALMVPPSAAQVLPGQFKSDWTGRLRSAAQRKRAHSAETAAKSGVGARITVEPVHASAEQPAMATAPAHAGSSQHMPAAGRPHTAPSASALTGLGRAAAGSVSAAAAPETTRKGADLGMAKLKAAQGDKSREHTAAGACKNDGVALTAAAVRHAFEVTIVRCNLAAGFAAVFDGASGASSTCYVCYQFPGVLTPKHLSMVENVNLLDVLALGIACESVDLCVQARRNICTQMKQIGRAAAIPHLKHLPATLWCFLQRSSCLHPYSLAPVGFLKTCASRCD